MLKLKILLGANQPGVWPCMLIAVGAKGVIDPKGLLSCRTGRQGRSTHVSIAEVKHEQKDMYDLKTCGPSM
jgi:hypothetical protein